MSKRGIKIAAAWCLVIGLLMEMSPGNTRICAADTEKTQDDSKSDSDAESMTTCISIDNKNRYEGMKTTYARGYVPAIEKKRAVIILPLLAKRKLSQNQMTVSVNLGDSENLPFVRKNYEKQVKLGRYGVGKQESLSGNYSECYLVRFRLKLKKKYMNGSYPVTLSVYAEDEKGNEIQQSFTVYVTLTDGKNPDGESEPKSGRAEEPPQFAPKIMLTSYEFSGDKVLCGRKFTAKITLLNTSRTNIAKNMLVTVDPGENVELAGKTNSTYVEELGAGQTCTLSFPFRINAAAPPGQYSIGVTMDYADSKAVSYNAQGTVKVTAGQPVKMEVSPVEMPDEIQMGETVEWQTQVMNIGRAKLYNVRAVMEADGLSPQAPAFIGDMEPGTSMTGSIELTAEGLSGDSLYGTSQGKVTYYYEDEAGNEMTQEQVFETAIRAPFDGDDEEGQSDDTSQWWVIMAVIIVFLGEAVVLFFMRRSKERRIQMGEQGNEN